MKILKFFNIIFNSDKVAFLQKEKTKKEVIKMHPDKLTCIGGIHCMCEKCIEKRESDRRLSELNEKEEER